MRIRKALVAGAAAILVTATITVAPSASADDSLYTGPVCNTESINLCLSADGNVGNYVYTKYYDDDNQEATTVNGVDACEGADVVEDGSHDTTPCPFADGSGMNSQYVTDLIVSLRNNKENGVWYEGSDFDVTQQATAGAGSGYLWVLAPAGDGNYYIISVVESNGGTEVHLCASGNGGLLDNTSSWGGAGSCEWSIP